MAQELSSSGFYQNIHELLIQEARRKVAVAINSAMVGAYWGIGKMIVEEEQEGQARAAYGEQLIPRLAAQLTQDFGKGFTQRNLYYMKQFYFTFPKVNAVRAELSWTHYRLLMKVENDQVRTFYQAEAIGQQWSTKP